MLKKIIAVLLCITAFLGTVYAAEWKFYSDEKNGYSGSVVIEYQEDDDDGTLLDEYEEQLEGMLQEMDEMEFSPVAKLSKELIWLCRKALNQYDIMDNEVYLIGIRKTTDDGDVLYTICVRIEDGGDSFSWIGYKATPK